MKKYPFERQLEPKNDTPFRLLTQKIQFNLELRKSENL